MLKPLKGLKVLDFTRVLAGPLCTQLLSDFGATVVKVERPGSGDDTRGWGPPYFEHNGQKTSTYFTSVNRNKKSISINLRDAGDRHKYLYPLVKWSDVIIHNYIDPKKFGIDESSILEILDKNDKSTKIYCEISGFPKINEKSSNKESVYSHLDPAYAVLIESIGGMMSITGTGDHPAKVGVAWTDVITGMNAMIGIMAARNHLLQNTMNKEPLYKVSTNLLHSQTFALMNVANATLNSSQEYQSQRWGTEHESIVPYGVYKCREEDGKPSFICICVGNDSQYQKLLDIFNNLENKSLRESLIILSQYLTNSERVENREKITFHLQNILSISDRDYWVSLFRSASIPSGPVNSVSDFFETNPQYNLICYDKDSRLKFIDNPIHLSMGRYTSQGSLKGRIPMEPGIDTREILEMLKK